MKIAVLGAGNVGKTLGQRWKDSGHSVVYGVRRPDGCADQAAIAASVFGAEAVVLAVTWSGVPEVLRAAGDLSGKVLIDATNPIKADFSGLELGLNDSGGELVARLAPGAKVVKAFNSIGFNIMDDPAFPQGAASLFMAGDDADAKALTAELGKALGFESVDVGPLTQSRGLEALAWLWISMAVMHGYGREIAFNLVKR